MLLAMWEKAWCQMDKPPNYNSKSFLLVDDESFMLGLIDRVLKQYQASRILRAPNGVSALDLLQGNVGQIDCIIADLNMKPMNGLQFLRAIRTGASPNVRRDQAFIMLTGHGDSDAVRTAVALDVHGYILKPISTGRLVKAIDLALSRPLTLKHVDHYRDIKLPAEFDVSDQTA
jgi:DNA-binding NarL/FixJ family response regulator